MCLVLTDREGGDHVPCADRDGGGQRACPGVIDEEIGPLRQFNTCCLHSMKPSLLPSKFHLHFHIISTYMCLSHAGPTYERNHVLCGLEHTIRSSK